MKIVILLTLFLGVVRPVFSNENTSLSKIKPPSTKTNKKFTLEFLITSEETKDIITKNYDGNYSKFDASLLQHLNKNNELRYFYAGRYVKTKSDEFGNEYENFFAEFMYRRKNIWDTNPLGLKISTELKYYKIIDQEIRERYGYNGAIIPQLIFKKKFGRYNSIKFKFRRHFFEQNNYLNGRFSSNGINYNENDYTLKYEDRVYMTLSRFIGNGFLVFADFKYQHKIRNADGIDYRYMELASFNPMRRELDVSNVPLAKKHQELVTFHPGVMYFLNRKNMLEVYAETKLSNTYDKRSFEEITKDELVYGFALYLTAF